MPTKSSLLNIAIGLVTIPARKKWPAHAEIALRDQATGTALGSLPFFSYEAGQQLVETLARLGLVDQATLTAACLELGRLALPATIQRFDRLFRSFGPQLGEQLVELFTGGLKPTSAERNTSFVICKGGRFCRSRACKRYAPHGALVLGGRDTASSQIVFTPTCQTVLLRKSLTNGLLTEPEFERLERLMGKIASLEETEVTQQADLLVSSAKSDEDRVRSLDLLFSDRRDSRANDFAPCGGFMSPPHVHFAGELARLKNPGRLNTVSEVNAAIDDLLACGGVSQRSAEAMRSKVTNLGLPAGDQKRRTPEDEIDDLLNDFVSLFSDDPRSAGMDGFTRIPVSPQMIEQIFRGQRGGRSRSVSFGGMGGFAG